MHNYKHSVVLCRCPWALAVVSVFFLASFIKPAAAQNTEFQYTPDGAFQEAVKEKLTGFYNEFWSDSSWGLPEGAPILAQTYFQAKWRVEEPYIKKIEQYFDQQATTPSKVIDFANAAEELFSSPKSKYGWDEALLAVMNKVLQRSDVEDIYKIRPGYIVGSVSKNKEGSIAQDFVYLGKDGELHKLSEIQSGDILLVFGSEGCNECSAFKKRIDTKFFKEQVKSGRLTILYITITWDLSFWKKKVKLPEHVISVFDVYHYITDQTYDPANSVGPLYNMSRYPVVYLIDGATRKVCLKDIYKNKLLTK